MAEFNEDLIDLGATPRQLIHSFIWAVIGLLCGLFFILATLFSGEPDRLAVIVGIVFIALALLSGALEYYDLPGAQLYFDNDALIVTSRKKSAKTNKIPYDHLDYLVLEPGPYAGSSEPEDLKKLVRFQFRPRPRGLRRPHWYLTVAIKDKYLAEFSSERYAVGGSAERMLLLERACLKHGVKFKEKEQ